MLNYFLDRRRLLIAGQEVMKMLQFINKIELHFIGAL